MDLLTIGLVALAAIIVYVIATHKSKKEEVQAEAPYKVETPEVPAEVTAAIVEGAGVVEVPAEKPAKAKKAPAKKPAAAKAKAPAKKPAAAKAPAKAKTAAKPKKAKA